MPYVVRTLAALAVLAPLACTSPTADEPTLPLPDAALGATTVTIVNDGAVALTQLRVLTSDVDSVPRIDALAPGKASGPYAVSSVHEAPLVESVVQGRTLIARPVEGFTGFNPARAAGAYVVRVRPTSDLGMLDVRVEAATR